MIIGREMDFITSIKSNLSRSNEKLVNNFIKFLYDKYHLKRTFVTFNSIIEYKFFKISIEMIERNENICLILFENQDLIDKLLDLEILPFLEILHLLKEKSVEDLIRIKSQIEEGNFSNTNIIHLQIEYSKITFKIIEGIDIIYDFEYFKNLPFYKNNITIPEVFSQDKLISENIENTAKEAIMILNFILSNVDSSKKNLVLGNLTYGSKFVVEPIQKHLLKSNIILNLEHKTSSSYNDIDTVFFEDIFKTYNKIFFIDGATDYIKLDSMILRFPRSIKKVFLRYYSENSKLNFYFWNPNIDYIIENRRINSDVIFLGRDIFPIKGKSNIQDNTLDNLVFFINSTTKLSQGYFDDFGNYSHNVFYFNKYGFSNINSKKFFENLEEIRKVITLKIAQRCDEYLKLKK